MGCGASSNGVAVAVPLSDAETTDRKEATQEWRIWNELDLRVNIVYALDV